MAEIEATLSRTNYELSPRSDYVFKTPATLTKRHITPRKQILPSSDILSSSNLAAEDQLEVNVGRSY